VLERSHGAPTTAAPPEPAAPTNESARSSKRGSPVSACMKMRSVASSAA
jgi:hypothetical protein